MKKAYSLIAKQFSSYAMEVINPFKGKDPENALVVDLGAPLAFTASAIIAYGGIFRMAAAATVIGIGIIASGALRRMGDNANLFDYEVTKKYGSSFNTEKYADELSTASSAVVLDLAGPLVAGLGQEHPLAVLGGVGISVWGAVTTYCVAQSVRSKLFNGPGLV